MGEKPLDVYETRSEDGDCEEDRHNARPNNNDMGGGEGGRGFDDKEQDSDDENEDYSGDEENDEDENEDFDDGAETDGGLGYEYDDKYMT